MGMLQSLETCLQIELHSWFKMFPRCPQFPTNCDCNIPKSRFADSANTLRSRFAPTRARAVGHDCHASGREAGAKIYIDYIYIYIAL